MALLIPAPIMWLLGWIELDRMLSFEGIALAIAAVIVAVQHTEQLGQNTTHLESVADELRGVARSVPTRGVGVFPSYLAEVPALIDRARENITILCDTPAHGTFSNTPAFTEYWSALRHKMVEGKVDIDCFFFDADGRRELHAAQIKADESDWDAWQTRNKANCDAFDGFARRHGVTPPASPDGRGPLGAWAATPADYIESMMAINKAVLKGFDGSVNIEELTVEKPLSEGPSVYFWRRDGDQEAVFVIVPAQGKGVSDLAGFHTREPDLIRALGKVLVHPKQSTANGQAPSATVTPSQP